MFEGDVLSHKLVESTNFSDVPSGDEAAVANLEAGESGCWDIGEEVGILVHLFLVPVLQVLLHRAGQLGQADDLGDLVNEDKVRLQGSDGDLGRDGAAA